MKFRKTITQCGVPLYVFRMPQATSIAMGILVRAGTRDERPGEEGIAHALEHMVFQGNERLADSMAITSEIENIGGEINAFTSSEVTFYHCAVPDDALQTGANCLASIVSTPRFLGENIETEMRNIAEEIKEYRDAPLKRCFRMLDEMLYGDHPLGKSTLGTKESVLGFKRHDFEKFHDDFYHPSNYTFVVVGKTNMEKATEAFDLAFSTQPPVKNAPVKNVRLATPLIRPDVRRRIEMRDVEQASVIFGTNICAALDEDSKSISFYSAMIGGGMSFPLFQEVRDKGGLCYSVGSGIDQSTDHGTFYAYVGTDPSKIEDANARIHDVIAGSCTQELFDKTRACLHGQCKVDLFSTPSTFLNLAVNDIALRGRPRSPSEILKHLDSLTLPQIKKAVDRYLLDTNAYSYAYVVPHGTNI